MSDQTEDDDDDGDDVDNDRGEQTSNCEPTAAAADSLIAENVTSADNAEQQATATKPTRSQSTRDTVQERIKELINVAHVSNRLHFFGNISVSVNLYSILSHSAFNVLGAPSTAETDAS